MIAASPQQVQNFTTRDAVQWASAHLPKTYPKVQKMIAEGRLIVVEEAQSSCKA